MFQPHAIVHCGKRLMVTCHTGADYRKVPWRILFNPLRYSVTINPGTKSRKIINENGRAHIAFANFRWRLKHGSTP